MTNRALRAAGLAGAVALLHASGAAAHCFVGSRFFPATLNVDDPCVADELSLPTVAAFPNGDDPFARETDISAEFSKRVTSTFGVSVAGTWTHLRPEGGPSVSGFQNLETTFKSQFYTNPEREFVLSAGLSVEWGGTGSKAVGADAFSTLTPTVWFGKGFGDLPSEFGWVRAFGLTGQIGYAVPTQSQTIEIDPDSGELATTLNPQFLQYGATLQYSMPYLKASVVDLGLPEFVHHLIPLVEVNLQTPIANASGTGIGTTGTVNPGFIWVGDKFQIGAEAIVPINRASGAGPGAIAQLHLFLDDIFPDTIGKPLLGD
jgi:hypothetical protein